MTDTKKPHAPKMQKPWYKSMSIGGALTAGVGIIMSPAVLALLPPKAATVVTTVGAVASAIGLRRAIP